MTKTLFLGRGPANPPFTNPPGLLLPSTLHSSAAGPLRAPESRKLSESSAPIGDVRLRNVSPSARCGKATGRPRLPDPTGCRSDRQTSHTRSRRPSGVLGSPRSASTGCGTPTRPSRSRRAFRPTRTQATTARPPTRPPRSCSGRRLGHGWVMGCAEGAGRESAPSALKRTSAPSGAV